MNKDKQIDEMAKLICAYPQCIQYNIIGGCTSGECQTADIAEALYYVGYRKQSEGEWISVDERLPDRTGKYLVATFDRRVSIGNLIDCYCDGDLSFDNYKVTHWMPLPEPPEMKGDGQ